MIKVKHIDHVAIAVPDAGGAAQQLGALFQLPATPLEHVVDQKTDVIFLTPEGETAIELICPSGNQSLTRFLEKRGPGLHHICFEVEDLSASLTALKAAGVSLIDEVPRRGARGHWVAFLHPKATGGVLYELCQKGEHP
jgi:methylmalonyl-CoA/ethylmalonyl-CoA epimerase